MTRQRGFTLVEILVALILMGIVGTAIYQLLVANQRLYRAQVESVSVNESARGTVAILPTEVRELSAGNGDILNMNATSLTYKSMQGMYFLCTAPDLAGLSITLDRTTSFGLRSISAAEDSILLFAEGDSTTRSDDGWVSASVSSTTAGTACPGSQPSITVGLSNIAASDLDLVQSGAPARTFRVAQIALYEDSGEWWLGGKTYEKSSGAWGAMQPLLGPLSGTGLALAYTDSTGTTTTDPTQVARVGITVQSQSQDLVYKTGGATTYLFQDLVTQVALRNNPTY